MLSYFLSKRIYSQNEKRNKVSNPAIRIATLGVALGLAIMIVSACVVVGFKHTIRDKAIGFVANITVGNYASFQGSDTYPICTGDSMKKALLGIEGVKSVEQYAEKHGILKTDSDFLGVVLKGIGEDYDTTFIHNNMEKGSIPKFSASKTSNTLLISRNMANKLRLDVGHRLMAYFIDNGDVRMRRFTIAGIYDTNMSKFDDVMCFTDLYTCRKLNGWEDDQSSGFQVTVNNIDSIDAVERNIVKKVNRTEDKYGSSYSSKTVMEMNPQLFAWLGLLDLNVWIILALMICVAGFTIISGLLIIILERVNMIGILKALGANNATIRKTFLWFAVFVIGKGMLWGNIVGLGLCILQYFTHIISLDPRTYYVSYVPVEINIVHIILLNIFTLIATVIVSVLPSMLISHIHPARSMRYE